MPTLTAWQVTQANPRLAMFSAAVDDYPAIVATLEDPQQPLTLLVAGNDALAADANWAAVAAEEAALAGFIRDNSIAGSYSADQLFASPPQQPIRNRSGDELTIDAQARTINGAQIVEPDQVATNGDVHTTDRPIVPASLPVPATTEPVAPTAPG